MAEPNAVELTGTIRLLERMITARDVEICRLRIERGRLEAKIGTYDEAALRQLVEAREIGDPPAQRVVLIAQAEEMHHALDHVVGCKDTCEQCRKVARSAMDHDNLTDFLEGT